MADRSAAGGVMVALVGAVALVAGVRGVYGKVWNDLTAGTGPQVSNPQTTTAGGSGGIGTILNAGGTAARSIGGPGSEYSLYTPQTPTGKYIAGAGLPDHSANSGAYQFAVAAGQVVAGVPALTSYNGQRDVARWSYAQNANESSWDHVDRLAHDLMKSYGWSLAQAEYEALREMYAAITAQGGNWASTGFGPVPLAGPLHV